MTVKMRFLRDVEAEGLCDICCFSGDGRRFKDTLKAGKVYSFAQVTYSAKVKARGGAYKLCTLYVDNDNFYTLHPDRLMDVPSNSFEVLSEEVTNTATG